MYKANASSDSVCLSAWLAGLGFSGPSRLGGEEYHFFLIMKRRSDASSDRSAGRYHCVHASNAVRRRARRACFHRRHLHRSRAAVPAHLARASQVQHPSKPSAASYASSSMTICGRPAPSAMDPLLRRVACSEMRRSSETKDLPHHALSGCVSPGGSEQGREGKGNEWGRGHTSCTC